MYEKRLLILHKSTAISIVEVEKACGNWKGMGYSETSVRNA
jgi:hypothetical protein